MNEQQKKSAIGIMNQLIEHPISKNFLNLSDSQKYQSERNLSDILSKLKEGKIENTENWLKEVELCLDDAETYFKQQPEETKTSKFSIIAASECRKIFQKLIKESPFLSTKDWCNEIAKLHERQLDYSRKPPRKIIPNVVELESYKQLKDLVPLTNAELKNFINATNMIQSEETSLGLVKILNEMQPGMKKNNSKELWIDITKLELNTVRALRDYLKQELGKNYPE